MRRVPQVSLVPAPHRGASRRAAYRDADVLCMYTMIMLADGDAPRRLHTATRSRATHRATTSARGTSPATSCSPITVSATLGPSPRQVPLRSTGTGPLPRRPQAYPTPALNLNPILQHRMPMVLVQVTGTTWTSPPARCSACTQRSRACSGAAAPCPRSTASCASRTGSSSPGLGAQTPRRTGRHRAGARSGPRWWSMRVRRRVGRSSWVLDCLWRRCGSLGVSPEA